VAALKLARSLCQGREPVNSNRTEADEVDLTLASTSHHRFDGDSDERASCCGREVQICAFCEEWRHTSTTFARFARYFAPVSRTHRT
jgi:hypothetical protein